MDNESKRHQSVRPLLPRQFLATTWGLWAALVLVFGAGCTGKTNFQPHPGTMAGEEEASRSGRNSDAIVVQDVNGKAHRPLAEGGEKATLFFFVLHDCPMANAYVPEMNRIAATYGAKGVRTYLVYAENDLDEAEARKHAREHELGFPAVMDRQLELVKAMGATISPEAALVSPEKQVVYHGRIDDRGVAPGKRRIEPTTRDLRQALDALLEGKPVPTPVTKAVGCYLPGKD